MYYEISWVVFISQILSFQLVQLEHLNFYCLVVGRGTQKRWKLLRRRFLLALGYACTTGCTEFNKG